MDYGLIIFVLTGALFYAVAAQPDEALSVTPSSEVTPYNAVMPYNSVMPPIGGVSFTSIEQNETSITLHWEVVGKYDEVILLLNGARINLNPTNGYGPVTHTVSSLTAGTKYTFTLFSVFEGVRSNGDNIAAVTAPSNAERFRSTGQDETSITLQWNQVTTNASFILQFNGTEINITAPDGDGPVTHTVSSLTAGTKYTFTLFSVFESVRSSGLNITAVTAPLNTEHFRSIRQKETSITLQWNQVTTNASFILQFNGTEINITAPDGDGPVTHTVSSLTAGTKYTFTLFSVFESVRSNGVNSTAVTAPSNAERFRSTGQDETSITLQWNQVTTNASFILQFNGTEINITAPDGDGPVTHTVSSLTAGTKYTFTLFSVFESVRSSGVNSTAVTDHVVGLNIRLKSLIQLSDLDIQRLLTEFLKQNGASPQLSLKIRSVKHETSGQD